MSYRVFDVLAAGLNLVRQRVATSTTTLLRSNARVAVMMPGQAATGVPTLPYHLCIIVLLALVSPTPFAAAAEGRYSNCSSFATNGSAASQFAYYRFYDFRNISADTWDSVGEPKSPNNVTAGASTDDMSWQLDWVRRDGLRYPGPDVGANLLPIDYQPDKVHIGMINTIHAALS